MLKPVTQHIKKAKRLLICPDGPLHFLPFATLCQSPNTYLIEKLPLSSILSATVYSEMKNVEKSSKNRHLPLVAFGDPVYTNVSGKKSAHDPVVRSLSRVFTFSPLPSTRTEVENLSNLYHQRVKKFLGKRAREEEAKKLSGNIAVVHFACHGILDDLFPLNSGLALTINTRLAEGDDNGILQAWEIFETLRINADLVTLSACQTALGTEMGGEGLIGLTRAFQYAGARAVLSTLWSVADETTAAFMNRFYSYLKKGRSKADALRMAQLDFIRSPGAVQKELKTKKTDVRQPFYWAGFVLNGD
ncbi:CHAT domain-containing protein [candidate division CSSED10-310 bacterium]|uniref:CHAT domain-containing protein n=1 Tax=candidate division CSSED10-310 bacterium TaxID=2855610 RepID=A0ABV6Z5T6_UNCC1